MVSNSPTSALMVFTVASTDGLGEVYCDSANCTPTLVRPVEAVKLLERIASGESATSTAFTLTGDFSCWPLIIKSRPAIEPFRAGLFEDPWARTSAVSCPAIFVLGLKATPNEDAKRAAS